MVAAVVEVTDGVLSLSVVTRGNMWDIMKMKEGRRERQRLRERRKERGLSGSGCGGDITQRLETRHGLVKMKEGERRRSR